MDINKEEVLNTIKQNYNKYSFDLYNFKIPLFIGSIDIIKLRSKLLNSRSYGELKFISDFKKLKHTIKKDKLGTYIEQFPIPINEETWLECCRKHKVVGYTGNNKYSIELKKLLVLDLYLPYLKTAIEIDYTSTHDKIFDMIRDLYLYKKHKIITIRFKNYGQSEDLDSIKRLNIGFLLKNTEYMVEEPYEIFDFKEEFIKGFERRYRLILNNVINPTKEFNKCLKKK